MKRTHSEPEGTYLLAAHWHSTDELADYLGISPRMVRKLLAQGMPSLRIGRARRFDPDAVLAWLRDQSEAA